MSRRHVPPPEALLGILLRTGWNAAHHCVTRDVRVDHGAGEDASSFTDTHARQDDRVRSHADVTANVHRITHHATRAMVLRSDFVSGRQDDDTVVERGAVTYSHCFTE